MLAQEHLQMAALRGFKRAALLFEPPFELGAGHDLKYNSYVAPSTGLSPRGCLRARRDPARRVGEIPNWRGERMLRDSLEPVYAAASRCALEYVFGRK
jgi:hypothetical protein